LSLVEVEELIKNFDPSTEGKECIEMGVDGEFLIEHVFQHYKELLRSSRNVIK
jgi:hypothetical protein